DFAAPLGADAVGIFGSDRPSGEFDASALSPDARTLYDQFAERFAAEQPQAAESPGPSLETPGAVDGADDEDEGGESGVEEGVWGFSAAWALFHDLLPAAAAGGPLSADAIASAARSVDLPAGSLPNGGGLHFSSDGSTLGQNERAIGLIQ